MRKKHVEEVEEGGEQEEQEHEEWCIETYRRTMA